MKVALIIMAAAIIIWQSIRAREREQATEERLDRIEENQEILAQHVLATRNKVSAADKRAAAFEKSYAAYVAKQEREQERIKKQLEKQEERMRKMEQVFYTAQEEISFQREQIRRLQAILERVELERDACIPGSNSYMKYEKKAITLDNQIRSAQRKMNKAAFDKAEAERKLSSAA